MKLETLVLNTVALSPIPLGEITRYVYGDEIATALMIGCLIGFIAGVIITLLRDDAAETSTKTMLEDEERLRNK